MPRGPIAGYGKAAEERALMCEDALWYLLQMEGVQQILRSQPQHTPLPHCPLRTRTAAEKSSYWARAPLSSPADLEQFRQECLGAGTKSFASRPNMDVRGGQVSACREPEVEGDDESAVEQGLGFGQAGPEDHPYPPRSLSVSHPPYIHPPYLPEGSAEMSRPQSASAVPPAERSAWDEGLRFALSSNIDPVLANQPRPPWPPARTPSSGFQVPPSPAEAEESDIFW
ncbi:uncharacterized protein MKK02DRAFT_41335 [Dioszegia hungarica]|uniref:Uncharacterized protein n=1 Tax=Dioszegia hungarica TaxID=4972 RepID=A0AA38LP88_9TREE|nr:uncharacterized protein MKK02DRAFT_41335 [Dioszegia hungarica]KAI9631707.1 hypothetical protein MKK02DRAFT_41335 [Dioszegia hungarica]